MIATNLRLVLGPPGTGKTTRLLELLNAELLGGVPPEAVAFVTFTRAARDEVRERVSKLFRFSPDDLPWFRTIHSAAFLLLGLHHGDVMTEDGWANFAERYGYMLTRDGAMVEDDHLAPPVVTADDALRSAVQWGRNRRITLQSAVNQAPVAAPWRQVQLFAERLLSHRAEKGLVDFPAMLERVLEEGRCPDVLVAFVDEAQDLSPLQIAVVEQWFEHCPRVYIAGDDDQAIYGFQGADPAWLVSLSRTADVEVLHRSHRVPALVHGLAGTIIGENRARVPKRYEPRPDPGSVSLLPADEVLSAVGDAQNVFVLARNRHYLAAWARRLRDADEPLVVEGWVGASPLGRQDLVTAVDAAVRLAKGGFIHASALCALLAFVPSRGSTVVPRGTAARAKRHRLPLTRAELDVDWGLGRFLAQLDAVGPVDVLTKLRLQDREYLKRLLSRHGHLPAPRFRLMTVHGSKGREADVVVVVPDMTRTTYWEYVKGGREAEEAENRVAYVAVTRARKKLILVEPTSRRFYPYARLLQRAHQLFESGCPHRTPPGAKRCCHLMDGGLCALPGGFVCVDRLWEERPA
ncbi:MAG: ATP-dependent helicase [Myxococcales bacterium]|nr:ATP-dependent helicase [Myxococcales bacterium]